MNHKSYEELNAILSDAKEKVEVGGKYIHYKHPDRNYTVLHVGLQEATEEPCVVYQTSHSSGLIWVRNLDDWLAKVENEKGEIVSRFTKIEE